MDDSSDEEDSLTQSFTSELPNCTMSDSKNSENRVQSNPADNILTSQRNIESDSDSDINAVNPNTKPDEIDSNDQNTEEARESSSDEDSSSDDDCPPLRIFRKTNTNRNIDNNVDVEVCEGLYI